MKAPEDTLNTRAADLRRAFDQSFAEEPRQGGGDSTSLLSIRVGGDVYGLRLSEIAGLFTDQTIVPVPSPLPELLGLAGLRGGIAPIYALRGLLGYPAGGEVPRWLVLASGTAVVGFAFDGFEGHHQVPTTDLFESRGEGARPHVSQAVRQGDTLRGILSIPSVVEAVRRRVGDRNPD